MRKRVSGFAGVTLWLSVVAAGALGSAPATARPAPAAKAVPAKASATKAVAKAAASKAAAKAAAIKAAEAATAARVTQVAAWVIDSGDNRIDSAPERRLPFVIIDKVGAAVFVFDAEGRLKAKAPALLGAARGDGSAPGVGDREMSDIPPQDRTTPAGRFVAGYGPAFGGEKVLWVDYGTAISLHPVVTAHPKERRPQRLASATPDDNRISYGCINVAASFYKKHVRPTFASTQGVVYILPEVEPLEQALPTFRPASEPVLTAVAAALQPKATKASHVASKKPKASAPANAQVARAAAPSEIATP